MIDSVATSAQPQTYQLITLENEWVRVELLPELGGRIYAYYDKVAGVDIFYRQSVIKPALVGLAGPWISGGVEFNWPQHHRPSTYMPCEWWISREDDGSVTVWMSEHEPMNRMKGMHGVRLKPSCSAVEVSVRLYNRTPLPQTFLWWANVAVRVHQDYQSFFPPDVTQVADHAKRATTTFPETFDRYYGVRYGERATHGVPEWQRPSRNPPRADVRPNRLDWYANIPVPTSYMAARSRFPFFGGYDHQTGAGFVHVADPGVSPGKKQWTWGNHAFGYAWDQHLSDDGEPYIELMAGVYTDNQPDFAHLAPYETKRFTQRWWPIHGLGPVVNANEDLAVAWHGPRVGLGSSVVLPHLTLEAWTNDELRFEAPCEVAPGTPTWIESDRLADADRIVVRDAQGAIRIECLAHPEPAPPLRQALEPAKPADVLSNAELHQIGTHLEQYRHATRAPEPYWIEAIQRDPKDSRCHTALGRRLLRRGLFAEALRHLEQAIEHLTTYNPNPVDGESDYLAAICHERMGDLGKAETHYGRAYWTHACRGAAAYAIARLAMARGDQSRAVWHLEDALTCLGDHSGARCLLAIAYRSLGSPSKSSELLSEVLAVDPLCHWALREAGLTDRYQAAMRADPQNYLDLALDYLSAGLTSSAKQVLDECLSPSAMVSVARRALGEPVALETDDDVYPSRPEEQMWLQREAEADPTGRLCCLLGNFLYDQGRGPEADRWWQRSTELNPNLSLAWRNQGIAAANLRGDWQGSLACYSRARSADAADARLLFEWDQLRKRIGECPELRLASLRQEMELVRGRDDLLLEYVGLLTVTNHPEEGLRELESRHFTPWEGGEGLTLRRYTHASLESARQLPIPERLVVLERALEPPRSLGEARHLLHNASDLWFGLGDAYGQTGQAQVSETFFMRAADFDDDFQDMTVMTISEQSYFRVLALRRLGRFDEANVVQTALAQEAKRLQTEPASIDYFATSVPSMLLFPEDVARIQRRRGRFLEAQAHILAGNNIKAKAALEAVLKETPDDYPSLVLFSGATS